MSTHEQRQQWAQLAEYAKRTNLLELSAYQLRALIYAVPALLADVAAAEARSDALAAELERVTTLLTEQREYWAGEYRKAAERLEQLTAPKFIDKVTELGNYVANLVPARKFDIVPGFGDKAYRLTWAIELDNGSTRDFTIIVTDDGKNEPFSAGGFTDEIVRTIQRTAVQWKYEELLQQP